MFNKEPKEKPKVKTLLQRIEELLLARIDHQDLQKADIIRLALDIVKMVRGVHEMYDKDEIVYFLIEGLKKHSITLIELELKYRSTMSEYDKTKGKDRAGELAGLLTTLKKSMQLERESMKHCKDLIEEIKQGKFKI